MGLFGGDEMQKVDLLTDGQQQVLYKLEQYLRGQVGKGAEGYRYSNVIGQQGGVGELPVAGASPLQQEAFSLADLYGSGTAAGERSGVLSRILSADVNDEVFREAAVANEAATRRGFESTIDQIMQRSAFGNRGSTIDALGDATVDLELGIGQQRAAANVAAETFRGRALDRALLGVEASRAEDVSPIGVKLAVGGEQRGIEGDLRGASFLEWLRTRPFANPALGLLAPTLGTQAYGFVGGGGGGKLAGAAGGAMTGAQLGMLTGNPWLAAGGAVAGGLIGAFA